MAVYIRRDLYEGVEREIEKIQREFNSLEEYVEFVLEELLREEEEKRVYSKEEEEEIKKRLSTRIHSIKGSQLLIFLGFRARRD